MSIKGSDLTEESAEISQHDIHTPKQDDDHPRLFHMEVPTGGHSYTWLLITVWSQQVF